MGVANVDSSQSWVSSTTEDSGFTSSRVLLYRMNWQLWKWKLKNPRAQKFWIHHHGWRMKKDQKLNSRNLTGRQEGSQEHGDRIVVGNLNSHSACWAFWPLFNVKTKRREGTRTGVGLTRKKKSIKWNLLSSIKTVFFLFNFSLSLPILCLTESLRGENVSLSLSNMTHYETKIRRGQHVLLQDYLVEIIDVKPLKESQKIFSQ